MKSRFVATMDALQEEAVKGDLSLKRIFEVMGEEGHSVLLIFLCIPYMQPIPIPGLSTPFGILMSLVAWFLYIQRPPWLPKRFEKLKISSQTVIKVSEVAEKFWRKAARFIKERWIFLYDYQIFRVLNMCLFVTNGLLLALPLPIPFSNMFPAMTILFCAVGHMERDGLFILLSYIWCLLSLSFFTALALGATWTVHAVS
ncbi:Exopolysaccharide synthesis, ExoD [compost metagenome]